MLRIISFYEQLKINNAPNTVVVRASIWQAWEMVEDFVRTLYDQL